MAATALRSQKYDRNSIDFPVTTPYTCLNRTAARQPVARDWAQPEWSTGFDKLSQRLVAELVEASAWWLSLSKPAPGG